MADINYAHMDDVANKWLLKHDLYENVLSHEDSAYGPTKTSYSSPYYDYQKAHEYYEQHKHLQGRTTRSKARLTDEGKEIYTVTQYNIKKAKENEQQSMTEQLTAQVNTIQNDIASLKALAATQRSGKKAAIQEKITSLRTYLSNKKAELKQALTNKSDSIKTENSQLTELVRKENQRVSERAKIDKERNSENVSKAIENKQNKIKSLGKTAQDAKEKERLRLDIAKLRGEKSTKNAQISSKATLEKSDNSSALREYKSMNSAELKNLRAQNTSEVKSASESVKTSIEGLRKDLSDYNADSRLRTKAATDEMRSAIKQLREINSQNKKLLTERYKQIQEEEFDKIFSRYEKKK